MALRNDIKQLESLIITGLANELQAQGHKLTGALEKSIQIKTRVFLNGLEMTGTFFKYGQYLDNGVPSSRIPFGKATGKKRSAYIQGLKEFVKLRRIETNDKKALGVAFAIAKTHKKEGMPTNNSFSPKFTKNGRRLDWLDFGLDAISEQLQDEIQRIVGNDFELSIDNLIRQ